nr:sulfite exporter TauE/SafE family protein [Arthrobacter castelli]
MGATLGFGLVVGLLLGLVGGGGSILAVPALVYGVGMPMAGAVPSSLVVVGASSAVGVLPRIRRSVDWQLALIIGVTGALAAFAGAAVNRLLEQRTLLLIFAVIMVAAGIRMFLPVKAGQAADRCHPDDIVQWGRFLPKSIATGVVVGFLTGMLGVGGGFLIVPALTLVLGVSMSVAVGTSLVIIVINSIGGVIAHAGDFTVDWSLTILFAIAAMAASLVGSRIGRSLPDKVLKRGFATLIMVVAIFVTLKVLLGG